MHANFAYLIFWVTGELSTLRQMMKVPNEPGLSPNNGLENAFLSNKSMASNPRKRHTNELNKIVIASTKAPGMTRPHSINTVKPDQNVHPREQCLGSTC